MLASLQDPLPRLIVQMILIVVSTRLLGVALRRCGQPLVIAEILGGILLGPSLLGWLAPGLSAELFPPASMPLLGGLSQVALVLFMFLVGLELDPKLLKGHGKAPIVISHTSIIVPFVLGAGLGLVAFDVLAEPAVPRGAFVLFMGMAMSITAFPVLARILAERRLMKSPLGALTLTCAAVDDITAWCLLAFVISWIRSTGASGALVTTGLAVGYCLVMMLLIRPLLARLAERSPHRDAPPPNMVALVLVFLLVSSLTTELIGIHALFGAFLFGVIMPRGGRFTRSLAEKIEDLVLTILLPLFFAFSGLRTQIGLLDTPAEWGLCILIILVACLGKIGGAALAGRWLRMPWREAGAIGILMNTRGLMELVALNIGLDLGVISPTLFTMMVLMALVTTFMTSPLLNWMGVGGSLVNGHGEKAPADGDQPYTVLACVANEHSGPGMARLAAALAGPGKGLACALRLTPSSDRSSFFLSQTQETRGSEALAPFLAEAGRLGLQARPLSFISADPARDICAVAEFQKADLVVLGWHKPLFGQDIFGGVVGQVLESTRHNTAVFVDHGLKDLRRVLAIAPDTPAGHIVRVVAERLATSGSIEVVVTSEAQPDAHPFDLVIAPQGTSLAQYRASLLYIHAAKK